MIPTLGRFGIVLVYTAFLYSLFLLPYVPWITSVVIVIVSGLGIGIAAQLVFDWSVRLEFTTVFWRGMAVFALAFVAFMILRLETLVCLFMAAPIVVLGLVAGILLCRWLISKFDGNTLRCTPLLALPFALSALDPSFLVSSKVYNVTNTRIVAASVSDLRAVATDVPLITNDERPWTFTHNILRAPRPLSAETIDGVRHAVWEQGVAFQEILDDQTDPNRLTWAFHFPDPDLMKPIDYRVSPVGPEVIMLSGGYVFEPLPNGKTRVTLTTTYRLNTVMNAYLALWGQQLLSDFHIAVLHVIANRAEAL